MRNKIIGLILLLVILIASFLRLWRLESVPSSLYLDELDLGYQAYSLLHTGRDYFGNSFPLHPHSFAEYRTPFNIYTTIPSVWLFGINAYGIRLPVAIFGILSVVGLYFLIGEMLNYKNTKKYKKVSTKTIALLGTALLAFSPWHIQFSRVSLEVSALVFFLIFGLYLFFKSINNSKLLWLSFLFLGITPWIYSTAKLFIPVFIIFMVSIWHKEILKFPKKELIKSVLVLLVLGLPMLYVILTGEGAMRFSYISVFTDPTASTEVGYEREFDSNVRGEEGIGRQPTISDKLFHNKLNFWGNKFLGNYVSALSTNFLFISGDPNLRHSPDGAGLLYLIEIIPLIVGIIMFFAEHRDKRIALFVLIWIIWGIVPSAMTRDGGNHAARLIIILPPLIFLIAYGLVRGMYLIKNLKVRYLSIIAYLLIWIVSFIFYQHIYWIHYPWDSERWWGAGWQEAIYSIKQVENKYNRIFISMEEEPSLIYFAGWYEYDPIKWQKTFSNGANFEDVGTIHAINVGKFYFPDRTGDTLKRVASDLKKGDLYLAHSSEMNGIEPNVSENIHEALKIVKVIEYPSGEDAFYLFSHN